MSVFTLFGKKYKVVKIYARYIFLIRIDEGKKEIV